VHAQAAIFLEELARRPYTFQVALRPAVFLDRDGTLTEEVGYVNHPRRLRLQPRSAEAVRRLNGAGIAVVIVTNQAGIARGYFSEEVLAAVHATLVSQLKDEGAYLDGIYACTHHPTAGEPPYRMVCDCRKPRPGLLLRAAAELGLDLSRSTLVGDRASDLVAGRAAGTRSVLVLTGYGLGEWEYQRDSFPVQPDHVAEDLLDAVEWVLEGRRP
jgi:D-glycero-D-manno-heptose 1,7-bisphosphate phosphatase